MIAAPPTGPPDSMQLLFDFFPIVAFYIAFKVSGDNIFTATATLIVAVIVQISVQWLRHQKVSKMALVSASLVLVFGGLTLLVHDEVFIKWKITVLMGLSAVAFVASHYFGDKPLVQRMMGESVELPRRDWLTLSWIWIGYFVVLATVNLYVAYNYATEVWVNFKMYGSLGITIAFIALQTWWLVSRLPHDSADQSKP
jgi:intracellular septation protein